MPLDIGLWRLDGQVHRLSAKSLPSEKRLEDLIEADPSVLGRPLIIIGRQVPTAHGKFIDLLAMDGDGALHVLELKRDRTPRDVVAQTLDYGSWVQSLDHDDVHGIYADYCAKTGQTEALEVAFDEAFGATLPDELNTGHLLTVVAGDLDSESERIVEYLASSYSVPINVAFFRYFVDGDREYLARTWLIDQQQEAGPKAGSTVRSREPWNGRDWYISFGEYPDGRSWEDARAHGFVSAGGGEWYSKTLRNVPEGARIWAYIPKVGYVGVGTVTGPATPLSASHLAERGGLVGSYVHANGEDEWVLPVRWEFTVPKAEAVAGKGLFANQNSAVRLRNAYTLERLRERFPVED